MNRTAKLLQQPINKTLRIWHLIALMVMLWIVPLFLPDSFLQQYAFGLIVVWMIGLQLLGKLIKLALRKTAVDVILIERFMIFASFALPTIMALVYGTRFGFDFFTLFGVAICSLISIVTLIGIVLHVRNADKFYHGVKKDKLFEP